jgi:hypothetical protein
MRQNKIVWKIPSLVFWISLDVEENTFENLHIRCITDNTIVLLHFRSRWIIHNLLGKCLVFKVVWTIFINWKSFGILNYHCELVFFC